MSDFDPVTLFFILYEGVGAWLWLLLGVALALLFGIVVGALKLHRAGKSMQGPMIAALGAGLAAAVAATFVVPAWTLADPGALDAAIDYAVALSFALIPGAAVAAIVFMLCAAASSGRVA